MALYNQDMCCVYRSKIRIRDGRAKPIDLLAKYISAEDDDLAVEMHEPYTFLNGLTVTDMDDLLEDIKVWLCSIQALQLYDYLRLAIIRCSDGVSIICNNEELKNCSL